MKIALTTFVIFIGLFFLLNPIYQVRDIVQVESLKGGSTDLPVITVHGGVDNYSLRTLGIKRKKIPVRGWLFSGRISQEKISRIKSVTLSTDDPNCLNKLGQDQTFDFDVITQNQVGRVVNFQIPFDFRLECTAIITVMANEEISDKLHTLDYRVLPAVKRGIRREWAR